MSTNNFCYMNRCIVVSDEDYECDNIPKRGEYIKDSSRNYPSNEIVLDNKTYPEAWSKSGEYKLQYTKVIITAGYYAHACIDYVQDEDKCFEVQYDCVPCMPRSLELHEEKTVHEEEAKKRVERILAREKVLVNRLLNRLKRNYGYTEAKRVCTMSNGEAIYKKIGRRK